MATEILSSTWDTTARQAATRARQLRPLALVLFGLLVAAIGINDVVKPLLGILPLWTAPGAPSLWVFLQKVSLIGLMATPMIALASVLWGGQAYLQQLGNGEVWSGATARLLRQVGECLLLSAALSAVIVPTLSRWLQARGGFDWQLETSAIALAALGGLLMLIAGVLRDVLGTAASLKAESDSFV